ncbi:MAG: gliding motility-associated C-terminal domain-containing protein [Bacteroidota bacterium]
MKKILLFIVLSIAINIHLSAQTNLCSTALPFSTGTVYNFPIGYTPGAGAGGGLQAEVGPNYGCLGGLPSPAWYYMKVCTPGNIEIYMHGTATEDIDFACWGPFSSLTAPTPCTALLTAGSPTPTHWGAGPSPNYPTLNMVDCSYSASYEEWCYIPNAQLGKYYLLMITNYSNVQQNVIFSQTNALAVGAGSTSGVILPPNITSNSPICAGDTLKLTADSIPNVQYVWSGPNNWSSFVRNPKIPNATAMNGGTYYLQVAGCGDVSAENITAVVIKPIPNVVTISDTICFGDTAVISASGANTYLWTPGNLTASTLKLTPGLTTNYSVTGTSLGCKKTATASIKVNPNPVVTANDAAICPKDSASLIANGASTYIWSNGTINPSIKVSPTTNTSYKVVGRDVNNCKDSTVSSVIVYPLPIIQLTPNTTICLGGSTNLTASGGISYLWNTIANDTTPTVTVTPILPLTTYTVGVTDINHCFDSASVEVTTIPLPVPTISNESDTICKGSYTTITADGGTSYLWNTGEITPSIYVKPLNSLIYSVTVSTSLNNIICSAVTSIQQNVRNCNVIYIPNSFSPFGYNTKFKPIGDIVITKSYQFAIYNRWGQMIFETTDISQGWDGRYKGDYVPAGAYIYYLKIDNGYEDPFEKIGTVTVIE